MGSRPFVLHSFHDVALQWAPHHLYYCLSPKFDSLSILDRERVVLLYMLAIKSVKSIHTSLLPPPPPLLGKMSIYCILFVVSEDFWVKRALTKFLVWLNPPPYVILVLSNL